MPTVLVIEDNENIRFEVSDFFQRNGFEVYGPEDLTNILKLTAKADAVLLDINLNGEDGLELCKRIREISNVPILFVTARDREEDELLALTLGGDDYIRKPYSLPVLLAKVKRMLERSNRNQINILTLGGISLNLINNQLTLENKEMELPKNEMKILTYLFLNKDNIVKKDELIEYLWENKAYVDENILNVNLSRLRKRLTDFGIGDLIETVPKQGYRIKGVD
jgi:DNA-binding response OmpR family regulator